MRCPYCGSELTYNSWDGNWFCEFDEVPIDYCDAIDEEDEESSEPKEVIEAKEKLARWNESARRWNGSL